MSERYVSLSALRAAVNASCDCGGSEPGRGCPACESWHRLRDSAATIAHLMLSTPSTEVSAHEVTTSTTPAAATSGGTGPEPPPGVPVGAVLAEVARATAKFELWDAAVAGLDRGALDVVLDPLTLQDSFEGRR